MPIPSTMSALGQQRGIPDVKAPNAPFFQSDGGNCPKTRGSKTPTPRGRPSSHQASLQASSHALFAVDHLPSEHLTSVDDRTGWRETPRFSSRAWFCFAATSRLLVPGPRRDYIPLESMRRELHILPLTGRDGWHSDVPWSRDSAIAHALPRSERGA